MNKRIALAVIIAVVAIGAIVVYADSRKAAAGSGPGILTGTTLDGKSFDFASTRGKPVVVNFFANWCVYCKQEATDLVAFSKAHPGVLFLGVVWKDHRSGAEAFVKKYGVDYPVVMDESGQIGDAWGVTGIPSTFFFDAQGTLKAVIPGAATRDMFEASLQKAL